MTKEEFDKVNPLSIVEHNDTHEKLYVTDFGKDAYGKYFILSKRFQLFKGNMDSFSLIM